MTGLRCGDAQRHNGCMTNHWPEPRSRGHGMPCPSGRNIGTRGYFFTISTSRVMVIVSPIISSPPGRVLDM